MTKPRLGAKPGRHSALTRTLIRAYAAEVSAGNYLATAAAAVGLDRSTLQRYLREGEAELEADAPRTLKAELVLETRRALARAVSERVKIIRRAGRKNWTAAAWWLERTEPDLWGRRDRRIAASPNAELLGDDAAARLADDLTAALEAGDQAAMREAIPRAMGLILNGSILRQLSALGPSTGAHALRALAKTLEDIGGAKLVYPVINVQMGRPAPAALPDVTDKNQTEPG